MTEGERLIMIHMWSVLDCMYTLTSPYHPCALRFQRGSESSRVLCSYILHTAQYNCSPTSTPFLPLTNYKSRHCTWSSRCLSHLIHLNQRLRELWMCFIILRWALSALGLYLVAFDDPLPKWIELRLSCLGKRTHEEDRPCFPEYGTLTWKACLCLPS